ncbi:MAG: hypothetical protein HC908_01505 [Calothrix sp. SM1_7_51]|nr:hypothetical protein [Calothrix sp. SM1_7_51]
MESQIKCDINDLIELVELATPDSLNIAEAILRNNNEIHIPELQSLREAVKRSLAEKKNAWLSDNVEEIKATIIASLIQKIEAIGEVTTGAK